MKQQKRNLKQMLLFLIWRLGALWKRLWSKKTEDINGISEVENLEVTLINKESYQHMFIVPSASPVIYMPRDVLEKIVTSLPSQYKLPSQEVLNILREAVFQANKNSIDQELINKITQSLPSDYVMVDTNVLQATMNNLLKETVK
jgi:hypothetical protein